MSTYQLFLDESKPNSNFNNFTLGGIAIESDTYEQQLKPAIHALKTQCFGRTDIILHEIDIRNRRNMFADISQDQQQDFFNKLNRLFLDNPWFHVLAVSINTEDLSTFYHDTDRNDLYYIALQLLMENFTQLLSLKNATGAIYLESTDDCNNARLQNLFHILKANGTLFLKKRILQQRLSTINFSSKKENIIGLQVADFVPNALARKALGKKQKNPSILNGIEARLYDGGINMKNRFGHKVIK
ncbi:MAG: DUF3800 domain-containing protein [Bacillota bacterium]|nr:DUF3800 domain-containing protein [Bacillota bacterium]